MGDLGRSIGLTTTCSVGVVGDVPITSDHLADMAAGPAVALLSAKTDTGNINATMASMRRCNRTHCIKKLLKPDIGTHDNIVWHASKLPQDALISNLGHAGVWKKYYKIGYNGDMCQMDIIIK